MNASVTDHRSGRGGRALGFILITVFLDTLGFAVIYPVMPKLILELGGGGLSDAAAFGGTLAFVFATLQFVCAPVLGGLSDRYGRRPVLLISLAAFGVDYVVMGFAPTMAWLFAARAVSGVFGSNIAAANAYAADVSGPEGRARAFGLIGAAWGAGFIFGPALGGLLGTINSRAPFFVAAALALANVLYGYFVLPESLDAKLRRPFSWRRANPIGALLQMRRYRQIVGLLGASFIFLFVHTGLPSTWTYFTMEQLHWTTAQVGYALATSGAAIMIVQGGFTGRIVALVGEKRAVFLGLTCTTLAFTGYAFAHQGWLLYLFMIPAALGTITNPSLLGIMSRQVPPDAQGELQGTLASIASVTATVSPLVMTRTFQSFANAGSAAYFPGAPLLLSAALVIVTAAICAASLRTATGKEVLSTSVG